MRFHPEIFVVAVLVSYTLIGALWIPLADSHGVFPYHLALPLSLILLGFLLLWPRPTTYWRLPGSTMRLFWICLPFLAALCLSAQRAGFSPQSVELLRNYAASVIFAILVGALVRRPRQLWWVLQALLWITAVGGLLGVLQTFVGPEISPTYLFTGTPAFSGLARSPLGYGHTEYKYGNDMLVGILPALGLYLCRRRLELGAAQRLCLVVILALAVSGLCLSRGASSILGVTVGGLYLAFREGSRTRKGLVAAAAAGVVLLFSFFPGPVDWLIVTHTSYSSLQLRSNLLHAGLRMFESSPLLGVGLGNFWILSPDYLLEVSRRVVTTAPHNMFLGVLVENGIVGLVLYLSIWWLAFRLANPATFAQPHEEMPRAVAVGLRAALLGYAVDSLFHNYFFDNHLWLLIGLCASVGGLGAAETTRAERSRWSWAGAGPPLAEPASAGSCRP